MTVAFHSSRQYVLHAHSTSQSMQFLNLYVTNFHCIQSLGPCNPRRLLFHISMSSVATRAWNPITPASGKFGLWSGCTHLSASVSVVWEASRWRSLPSVVLLQNYGHFGLANQRLMAAGSRDSRSWRARCCRAEQWTQALCWRRRLSPRRGHRGAKPPHSRLRSMSLAS